MVVQDLEQDVRDFLGTRKLHSVAAVLVWLHELVGFENLFGCTAVVDELDDHLGRSSLTDPPRELLECRDDGAGAVGRFPKVGGKEDFALGSNDAVGIVSDDGGDGRDDGERAHARRGDERRGDEASERILFEGAENFEINLFRNKHISRSSSQLCPSVSDAHLEEEVARSSRKVA